MNEECCRSEPAGGVGRAEKNTLSGWFLILRRRLQRLQLMLPGLQATKFRTVFGRSWSRLAIDLRRIVRGTSAESEL